MLNQINDYTLLDILGHGSYGIVYLAESFKKEKFALKLIKINDKILNYAMTEAQTYVSLDHPNILKAREFFTYKQETYLVIVLEYCQDGDLSKLIGKLDEQQCEQLMRQITEGLAYTHSKDLTHRDIKPQNILMMKGVPKITDFGLTKSMTSQGASTKIGTPLYMAPEVQLEQKYDQDRKYSADVWSLGIVFFELLLGTRIFNLIEGDKMPCLRKDFPPEELLNKIKSQKLRTLIRQMLEKDAEKRLSSKEVLQTLTNGPKQCEQKVQLIDERLGISDFKQLHNLLLQNYKFVNLKTISLGYGQMTDKEVKALAFAGSNFPNLATIYLGGNQITNEGVKALAVAAGNFPNLKVIDFSNNQVTDKGLKALIDANGNSPNLTGIYLSNNYIRDQGLKALSVTAGKFPNLTEIDLGGNQITDEGLKALADAGSKFPNLTKINFTGNKIRDGGVKALAVAAGQFPNLVDIDLRNNKITDEGVKALAEAAHLFKKLKKIDFSFNDTSQEQLSNWLSKQKIPFQIEF